VTELVRPKVALVTGGSRGIGRAIAIRLAADGVEVALSYRNDETAAQDVVQTISDSGGTAVAIRADLSKPDEAHSLATAALAWRGSLNYLVNNAGMMRVAPPDTLTEREFRRVLEVNLVAPFIVIWQLVSELTRTGGAVVNIGSVAGSTPAPDRIAYCTSKAGLDMLTRSCALALGPAVRVNCVAPGSTKTDALLGMPESYVQPLLDKTALRRAGEPAEIASAVSFLLSDEASFITGETIYVSGGHGR
jgi:3-oxoacyl-[acyl-carrier protein] reductase